MGLENVYQWLVGVRITGNETCQRRSVNVNISLYIYIYLYIKETGWIEDVRFL